MAIFVGLLTGFLMCIPIGPLNVWVMQTVIKKSTLAALLVALGGSIMDVIYFYAILSGLSFISIPEGWITPLKTVGIVLIIILGIKELMSRPSANDLESPKKKVSIQGMGGYFLLGVIIYTSNPTLIITMSGLGTFIKSLGLMEFNQFNIILLSTSLGLGSFLWFAFLSFFVRKYQDTIRGKYLKRFSTISGVLMIGLGVIMGYQLSGL